MTALAAARVYIDTRNYQRAKEVLSQALSANPNDPYLLAHYASAEYGLGDYQAAAHSAYAALAHDPDNGFPMRLYSLSLSELGHHQQALQVAWRTVITHPLAPRAHQVYAPVSCTTRVTLTRRSRQPWIPRWVTRRGATSRCSWSG